MIMNKTNIEWADVTWNPVTGCTKVSPGCKYCYAEAMASRIQTMGGKAAERYRNGFDVTLQPDKLGDPLKWTKPRTVFVCSMSDLFHALVPFEYVLQVFETMERAARHTFIVCTKRPGRTLGFCHRYGIGDANPWPSNVQLLTSVEDQPTANERVPLLLQCPAPVLGVSMEPLLSGVLLDRSWISKCCPQCWGHYDGNGHCENCDGVDCHDRRLISWVIAGAESGPNRRPCEADWLRSLRDQCLAAAVPVPFFLKQAEACRIATWTERLDGTWDYGAGYNMGTVGTAGDWCVWSGSDVGGIRRRGKAADLASAKTAVETAASRLWRRVLKMPRLDGKVWDQMPEVQQ